MKGMVIIMEKSYMNDAIVGNSRMLGCINREGKLQRLFWPDIDHMQGIDRFEVGFCLDGDKISFLKHQDFIIDQGYQKGTNILNTVYNSKKLGLRIRQTDFCLMDRDVLLRNYEVENLSGSEHELCCLLYSRALNSVSHLTGSLFDFDNEALVHYQRDYYMAVSANYPAEGFQIGGKAREALQKGTLQSRDSVLMVPDGALLWNMGTIKTEGKLKLTIQICFAHSYKELRELVKKSRTEDGEVLCRDTKSFWQRYLKSCSRFRSDNPLYDDLYERSLLVFRLMYNEKSGGLMAAPELDEALKFCGRYGYCWGRDAAFIADALDLCGLNAEAEQFYRYAALNQEEDGSWFQRYCMDGNLAPAWGLQVDETGALLYGIRKHYERTKESRFLEDLWENVKSAADFLVDFIDPETGLPKQSHDLWEERWGEHAYSAAAVCSGLVSAAKIADCLDKNEEKPRWELAARKIKQAIGTELWDEDMQCFLRGVRTQLYPPEKMDGQECMMVPANQKGTLRKVVCRDRIVDISLIGLSVPFEVFDSKDFRMKATVRKIEESLICRKVGGIKRYEDDEYMGGNPWILTTLWLALYYTKTGEFDKALQYFNWAVKGRTRLNLLPEQISKETGEPVWVLPLTWSHAMYVLVYQALLEKSII